MDASSEWDPNPPHAAGGLYIVYYYRGAKVVQSILDTYPLGFPAAAAQQQVDRVIGALLAMGPEAEALSDLLLPYPLVMSELADAGLHDVAVDRCSEFVAALQGQDLRHGAMLEVLAAVAGDEPDVVGIPVARVGLRPRIRHSEAGAGHHHDGTPPGAGLGEAVQAGGGHGA